MVGHMLRIALVAGLRYELSGDGRVHGRSLLHGGVGLRRTLVHVAARIGQVLASPIE